jgi:hypothetical protein
MLSKRLFPGVLLLTALVIITGSAAAGESSDDSSRQYKIAHDVCIRMGLRSGSYDYNRCVEKILKPSNIKPSPEQEPVESQDSASNQNKQDSVESRDSSSSQYKQDSGESRGDSSSQFRSADDKCIKLGFKRGTDDYNRCMVILLGIEN